MTSGGTESILTAVKALRDYMGATRGITQPEMVIAISAHAAFIKAAEYFGIRLVRLPVGPDYRLSGAAVAGAMTPNTVLVVASSPGFPHGVVDHVADIAAAARRRGVPCHVDCCLGGFVLPFAAKLGYPVPRFDFSVPGVTSMSVDTHKFGMGHKGTSVVLYRSKAIRCGRRGRRLLWWAVVRCHPGTYTVSTSTPGSAIGPRSAPPRPLVTSTPACPPCLQAAPVHQHHRLDRRPVHLPRLCRLALRGPHRHRMGGAGAPGGEGIPAVHRVHDEGGGCLPGGGGGDRRAGGDGQPGDVRGGLQVHTEVRERGFCVGVFVWGCG